MQKVSRLHQALDNMSDPGGQRRTNHPAASLSHVCTTTCSTGCTRSTSSSPVPLGTRWAQKATDAAAAALSWTPLSSPSGQEDKDGALKLVSDSADTIAHAQWPKHRHGEAKENPCWGYLLTADQDKSHQKVLFHRFTTRYAKRTVCNLRGNFAQVPLDESEIAIIDVCMLRRRFQCV